MTTQLIPATDPRLGRHVEHDERSRSFSFTDRAEFTQLPLVDTIWPAPAPILDQKKIGGCVGFTGADVLNMPQFDAVRKAHHKGKTYANADGIKFYEAATVADDIPGTYKPDDTGSSGLGLAKALQKLGLITSYTHAFGWDALVQALLAGPVAVGTLWTNDMFNPNDNGVLTVGALSQSNVAGGHEYMLRAILPSKGLVLMRNHWNTSWSPGTDGVKVAGEAYIPISQAKTLFSSSAQGDATVLHA